MMLVTRGWRILKTKIENIYERRLVGKNFILLSNNCWGYELYGASRKAYNTPLVGLFMYPTCYIKFLSDLEYYLDCEVRFVNKSKYFNQAPSWPVGVIDNDIEIHFVHYIDEYECISKWNRRKERLKKDLLDYIFLYSQKCVIGMAVKIFIYHVFIRLNDLILFHLGARRLELEFTSK